MLYNKEQFESRAKPAILAPDKPLHISPLKEQHFFLYQLPSALIPQAAVGSSGLAFSDMGFKFEINENKKDQKRNVKKWLDVNAIFYKNVSHFIVHILDHYLSSLTKKYMILLISTHYGLPIALSIFRTFTNCQRRCLEAEGKTEQAQIFKETVSRYLTAAPESRPKILRLSGFDSKRISYIFFASKYPIPEKVIA